MFTCGMCDKRRKCDVRNFQCACSCESRRRIVFIRRACIFCAILGMLRPPSLIGRARMSRLIAGRLLSQKKTYMISLISCIAHGGK